MPSATIRSVIASSEGPPGSHGRPNPLRPKGLKPSPWRWYLLLFAAFLVACDRAGEAERLLASAEQSRQAGQLKVAADLYHRAADLREGDFDTQYQAALLDLEVRNLDEAEGHLEKAVSLRPDFAPAHLNLGVVFVQRGQRAEGRKAFLDALRLDPRLTRAYYNLGVLELDDGQLDAAEMLFKQTLGRDPTHRASYVRLGNLYVKQRKFAAARHVLGEALQRGPNDAKSFFFLGLAHEGLGEYEHSIAAFRRAIELNPSSTQAHYNLGTVLLRTNAYQAARTSLHEALRLDPHASDAWYNLAVASTRLGEKDQALQQLKRAIEFNPALAAEAQGDSDFTSLHTDPDFLAVTQRLERNPG